MVKIIGIFAIVFVYYCEIYAELDNLEYWKTPTVNERRILFSKKTFAGNKYGGIKLRSNEAQPHTKFTTGFREDIRDQHKEYIVRNGVARYYDLEHNVVKKRRFKRNYRYDEYNQTGEHDNERKKLKKKKKHHHSSTRNKKTKLYNNEERNLHKDKILMKISNILNKENNYSGKKKRDKNHSKYLEHLKDMSMSHKRVKDHINKKKKGKDKSKDKQREKNMDRNKHASRGGPMIISKMGMMSLTIQNDHKHNKKQKLNNTKDNDHKHNKTKKLNNTKDNDHKHNKTKKLNNTKDNDHKHNKTQKLNKTKDKQREKSMDRNKHTTTGGPMRTSQMGMMSPANKTAHTQSKKLKLNKSKEKQREKSKHTIDTSKTAIGIAGLGTAGVAAMVGKSLPWKPIKEPKLQSEEVFTSTRTPKPPREPIKLIKRERSNLRTKEKIRFTKMIPFSLNNQEDEGKEKLRQKSKDSGSPSPGSPPSYLSPYAITAQMELLMNEFPDVNATITKVGRTVEYNDIILVRITAKKPDDAYFRAKETKYVDDVPEKKIIFIVHGLTVMGLKDMTSLVKSSELKILLSYYFVHIDKFDFFLMPLANPDGYSASLSYIQSEFAIWNKNVSPQSVCPGVFVDRNFDVAWNHTKEVSSCSQLYPGATPFSEEESKVVRDVFHKFSHKILAYIHVHAGTYDDKVFKGDAILYPRGFIETQSDDDKYIDIKAEVDEAMKNASFRVMSATVDTLYNWYGVVTGTSVDYAATVFGITYAMEFVMQLYDSERLNNNALTEIWSRLIDATFNKMWKSQQGGSDAR